MKNKKTVIGICIIAAAMLVFAVIMLQGNDKVRTVEERQDLIKEIEVGANIISEIFVEDHIVSEITSGNKYGYAVFSPEGEGKYKYRDSALSEAPTHVYTISINENLYTLFICHNADVDYGEVVYADTYSGKIIERHKIELNGKTLVAKKSPDSWAYTIDVTWYDSEGNEVAE